MLLSASAVTFDFEDQAATSLPRSGAYETLSMTKSGLTLEISRPGSRFDVVANTGTGQGKPAPFGSRSLDPFVDEGNAPFIFNFSVPVKGVSLLMGDYGQDSPDSLVVEAFSGPNATGERVAGASDSLPTLPGDDPFDYRQLIVDGDGIRSLKVIGGTPEHPNSTFIDQVMATAAAVGVDLAVSIDADGVVPSLAADLNLNHIFGNEEVNVPVTIENLGTDKAKGSATITVYLSASPDLSGKPVKVGTKTVSVDLEHFGKASFTVSATVPGGKLQGSHEYYFVAKITAPKIKEGTSGDPQTANNVAATPHTFQFLGKPKSYFSAARYFDAIRKTLEVPQYNPFAHQGAPVPTDGPHYSAAFENPGGYDRPVTHAYVDEEGVPTIGTGLNLNQLDADVRTALAADVRAYYAGLNAASQANYRTRVGNPSGMTDGQIIRMLKNQAGRDTTQVITDEDAKALFEITYARHRATAQGLVRAGVADKVFTVLVDIDFNSKLSKWTGLLAAVNATEYNAVLAGFRMIDSKRAGQVQSDRVVANYQYLLSGQESSIGKLLS